MDSRMLIALLCLSNALLGLAVLYQTKKNKKLRLEVLELHGRLNARILHPPVPPFAPGTAPDSEEDVWKQWSSK